MARKNMDLKDNETHCHSIPLRLRGGADNINDDLENSRSDPDASFKSQMVLLIRILYNVLSKYIKL